MNFILIASLSAVCLFIGMLITFELGRRIGIARFKRDPEGLAKGAGSAEAAVFGLLGLIIAFTFSGAASRFEGRLHLITDEANNIGTAFLRLDLLPADAQPELRTLFREYVEVRATSYQNASDKAATKAKLDRTAALQKEIWSKSLVATQRPDAPSQATMLLLPALNQMIDITTTRMMALRTHPPMVIFMLLGFLSLVGALLVGYGTSTNKKRSWIHIVVFAGIMSLSTYVILDIEFPRRGLIKVETADQVLIELRQSMQ
jgi:hypothetical protein